MTGHMTISGFCPKFFLPVWRSADGFTTLDLEEAENVQGMMENKSRPLCLFWTYEVSTRGDTLLMLELAAEFIALGYRIQLESPSGVLPKELHPKGAFRVRVNPHLTKLLYGKNVGGGLRTVDIMVAWMGIWLYLNTPHLTLNAVVLGGV